MIKNYGLDWKLSVTENRNDLEGKRGKLRIDFRTQVGWYILMKHNKNKYVGMTTEGFWKRLKSHYKSKSGEWTTFSWFGVYPIDLVEQKLIYKHPKFEANNLIADTEALLIYLNGGDLNKNGGKYQHMMEFKQLPYEKR